jgi:hypothetical protein
VASSGTFSRHCLGVYERAIYLRQVVCCGVKVRNSCDDLGAVSAV